MDSALFPDREPEKMAKEELIASYHRLKTFAEKYRHYEEALRLDEARLEALLVLNDMSPASEESIISFALEEAIRLTGSQIGWMGALSPDERLLTMHCWSKGTKDSCGVPDRTHSICIANGGLWVEPILQRKPIIINGLDDRVTNKVPYGHIPVMRFLGIPVYDGGRIVAVAEVGNKPSDYDPSDLRQLALLMGGVWKAILRRRAEDGLSDLKAQADLYVDFMAHDISNMNQVAMGFLELAMDKLAGEGRLEKDDLFMLAKPMATMRNSAKLIDNVKKLQRLRDGLIEPKLMVLDEVLRSVIDSFSRPPGRSIRIEYFAEKGARVKANELLKDVFSNILENAVKHSRPDKPLSIAVQLTTVNGWHRVAIEDNGPGIPDERKCDVFERLSRGKMKSLPAGMGLGLVKTLVESFNGRIHAEDRVAGDHRQGCRFVVELPDAC